MRYYATLVLTALCITPTQHATAQSPGAYPARPIRLLLPASPGGPVDVIARTIFTGLSETLGQAIVIDNRPGRPLHDSRFTIHETG